MKTMLQLYHFIKARGIEMLDTDGIPFGLGVLLILVIMWRRSNLKIIDERNSSSSSAIARLGSLNQSQSNRFEPEQVAGATFDYQSNRCKNLKSKIQSRKDGRGEVEK
jgi:hypothetical protein